MPMGEDFNYVSANSWYKNLDKLIRHVNRMEQQESGEEKKPLNLLYSTPSCYLKSLHESGGVRWPDKSDDFFPYASDPHAYWTGYFTSRPTLKRMVRYGNNFLQVCKQMDALTNRDWTPGLEGDLDVMREAMGVLQHHDAVSGTAKQAVTDDYALRLAKGFKECEKVIQHGYDVLMGGKEEKGPAHGFCHLSNITQCPAIERSAGGDFVVTLYNPLVRRVSTFVRLPVVQNRGGMEVVAPNGQEVTTQLVPLPKEVLLIPGRKSRAAHELVFRADLPPLGFKSFFVRQTGSPWRPEQMSRVTRGKRRATIGNGIISLSTDSRGALKRLVSGGQAHELRQAFFYYEGHAGHNKDFDDRASGAYIFRPKSQAARQLNFTGITKVSGPLVEELHMGTAGHFASQVVRLYAESKEAEFEWLVGPIPTSDGVGKEIVTRYSTDIR